MNSYNVVVFPNALNFDIEAEDEQEAIDRAHAMSIAMSQTDLLRDADYSVDLIC